MHKAEPHPVEAMQSAMSDPEVVRKVQEELLRYQPVLDRLTELLEGGDPVAKNATREIACFVCDLCAHLGVEYDPAMGTLLLQFVGSMMARSPEKWEGYARDIAPQCNANRLRMTEARGSS